MTNERAIEIIKTEKECILRNQNGCNRFGCSICDLALPEDEILEAYDLAINSLDSEHYCGADMREVGDR